MKKDYNNILDKTSEYCFYLLAASVAFSNALTEIATAGVIFLWVSKLILNKRFKLPGGSITIILFIYLAWNLASFINTNHIYESLRGLLKVLKHILLFIAALEFFSTEMRIKRFILFTLGFGFLIGLNGIIQYILGFDLIRQRTINLLDPLYRGSSSFRHSNDFGAYLVLIISLTLGLLFSTSRGIRQRILLVIVLLTTGWCIYATDSRGAWLSILAAVAILAVLKSRKLIYALLILILLSPIYIPDNIKQRCSEMFTVEEGGTVWQRTKLWSGAVEMIKEHPVVGFGVNTYTKNFPDYKPKDYADVIYTHNCYLHMAVEIGLIGSLIFLIFLLRLYLSVWHKCRLLKKGFIRDACLGLFAGSIGFLIHCAVDTHLYSVTLSAFIFLYLGLLTAFGRLTYEKR
jgi:putative inorganic carbon (HCO3(-)) transporter